MNWAINNMKNLNRNNFEMIELDKRREQESSVIKKTLFI